MDRITGLTDNTYQDLTITVGENETCIVRLRFAPTQYAWYFDWEYKNIVSKGNKITLTPNALRQFKGRIPFGLYFIVKILSLYLLCGLIISERCRGNNAFL